MVVDIDVRELQQMPLHHSRLITTEYALPLNGTGSVMIVITRVPGGWTYFYCLNSTAVFIPEPKAAPKGAYPL
jgi:hypothetical protein